MRFCFALPWTVSVPCFLGIVWVCPGSLVSVICCLSGCSPPFASLAECVCRLGWLDGVDGPLPCRIGHSGEECLGVPGFSGCYPTRLGGSAFQLQIGPSETITRPGCRTFRCRILRIRLLQKLYTEISFYCNASVVLMEPAKASFLLGFCVSGDICRLRAE